MSPHNSVTSAESVTAEQSLSESSLAYELYQNASADVSPRGLQQISEISMNAFRAGAPLEQVLAMHRQFNPQYPGQVARVGTEAVEGVVRQAQVKADIQQQAIQPTTQSAEIPARLSSPSLLITQ